MEWKKDITAYLQTHLYRQRGKPLLTNPVRDWERLLVASGALTALVVIGSVWLFVRVDGGNLLTVDPDTQLPVQTIDRGKLSEILEFFESQEALHQDLRTQPPQVIDPSTN